MEKLCDYPCVRNPYTNYPESFKLATTLHKHKYFNHHTNGLGVRHTGRDAVVAARLSGFKVARGVKILQGIGIYFI